MSSTTALAQPPRAAVGAAARGGVPGSTNRTLPCRWCGHPIPPACCAPCLNRLVRSRRTPATGGSCTTLPGDFASLLAERTPALALAERRALLRERLPELRDASLRRAAAAQARRRQIEERRELLRERRRKQEVRSAALLAVRQRLEAKRPAVPRDVFLRDPARHSAEIGAFHVYQELSVVSSALQAERRRRCAEVLDALPLKWIASGASGASVDDATILGQAGGSDDEQPRDRDAAFALLVPIVSWLAVFLDVTLPFPCRSCLGHLAATEATQLAASVQSAAAAASAGGDSTPDAGSAWWASPSILHPYHQKRHFFDATAAAAASAAFTAASAAVPLTASLGASGLGASFAGALEASDIGFAASASSSGAAGASGAGAGITAPGSGGGGVGAGGPVLARRLFDEDLRCLCSTQGVLPSQAPGAGTLRLLMLVLHSAHLGCVNQPAPLAAFGGNSAAGVTASARSAASALGSASAGQQSQLSQQLCSGGTSMSVHEDGEWTVVGLDFVDDG
eukprot:TRINITY_DN19419_c1_g1_i1.p1 TRINITY_DN19419_c1_g1~~TRINITY_DN19419_c1_g1_i1.p1  ORF type:complete len:511 (-),score=122.01 TRINITY_DN19419_c1_g1_i1:147-1679(-)